MLNQPNIDCLTCGKEFTYRKNKTYCSNACKQKAYLAAKNGLPLTTQQTPKSTDFSLNEYLTYRNEVNKDMPIIEFFFLRRNLYKQATKEQIENYINGFCGFDFWETLTSSTAYKRFEADYLDNKYTIGC